MMYYIASHVAILTMAISPAVPESKGNISNEELESEDLKQFRQEWLQELQKRNVVSSTPTLDSEAAGTSPTSPRNLEGFPNVTESRNLVNRSKEPRNMSGHPLVRNGEIGVEV